jgi:hypothetical protein
MATNDMEGPPMHKAYILQEGEGMRRVLDETYGELLAALKEKQR